MPRKYNATQESVIRGGYVPFLLQRDIDQASLKGAIQELNNTNRAAIQQKNVIMEALAKADLNPADAAWRDAYAQQIESELAKEVIGGSYAKALPTAMELAGKVASNPELMARQKANKEYQAHKGVVDNMVASGKLPQRIADQWMEENPYTFKPVVDKTTGRVIGGEEWRPNWNVVSPIDMTQVYEEVFKLAGKEAGGGENVRFVDENGNVVTNPANGMYSMQIKTGSKWERVPAEKLKRIFRAALDQIPGAKETFEQDYRNKLWQYSKADEDGKKEFYGSDIMDSQGIKRTLDEYINYKANPILQDMAVNNVWSDISYTANDSYLSGRMQQAADRAAAQAVIDAGEQIGAPMVLPLNNVLSENTLGITRSLNGILDLYKNTSLFGSNKNIINGYINRGDYTGLADFLSQRQRFITNVDDKVKLQNYLRTLRSNGASYNNLTSGIPQEELDVLNAYVSLKTGTPLPNAKNSKVAKDLAFRKNTLFNSLDGNYPQNSFYMALATDDVYNRFLSSLNLTPNELKAHGITISKKGGKTVLDVTKNTDILPEIAEFVRQEESRDATRNWSLKSGLGNFGDKNVVVGRHTITTPVSIDPFNPIGTLANMAVGTIFSPGNVKKLFNDGYDITRDDITAKNILMDFSPKSDYYTNLEQKTNTILKNHGKVMVSNPQVTAWGSGSSYALQDLAKNGMMKITDLKSSDDLVTGQERELIKTGLGHIGDFRVWKLDPETKNMELVRPDEEEEIQKLLNAAVADDKFSVKYTTSDTHVAGMGKGYGHYIDIPAGTDKEGNPQGIRKHQQYYIEGLADSKTAEAMASHPELIYNKEYHVARALNTPIKDVVGNPIVYDAGNEEIERNKFMAVKAMDDIYRNIEQLAYNSRNNKNASINEQQYEIWAKNLLITSGYDPETTEGKRAKTRLMDKFRNQFNVIHNAK